MPSTLGLTSRILLAVVLCLVTAVALAPAPCAGSGDQNGGGDVIGFIFPSLQGPQYDSSGLHFSLDAGLLGRALHLTADDVYQPPVLYAPDAKRSAGHVSVDRGFPLAVGSYPYSDWIFPVPKEASFNTSFTFTMSVASRSDGGEDDDVDGGLLLEILPSYRSGLDRAIYYPLQHSSSSGNISVEMGKLEYYYDQGQFALYVSIVPAPAAPPKKYTAWIDYDAKAHNLSVYVDEEGKAKPGEAILRAPLNISAVVSDVVRPILTTSGYGGLVTAPYGGSYFGLFASKDRLSPSCQVVVYTWNLMVEDISVGYTTRWPRPRRRLMVRWLLVVALSSVIAGAVAALALAMACCLVSRYRILTTNLKLSKAMRRLPGVPRELRYADVKKATRNFHESMRLGSGGFGAVYKGAMIATCDGDDGRQRLQYVEVAVKKFTRNKESRSYDDFLAEVAVINRLRHRNIVPLIGWCYKDGELLLIYQYMPNGSLDQHLFRGNKNNLPILRWETRYNILKDIAAGLHYVHHEYDRVVLHRDIKASNIMIDADFHGRLGDFGLARVVALDKTSFTDLGVAGTWGFIAPEYAVSHKATRQTDVYAFGVLVLEVVTGKRSPSNADDDTFPLLTDCVWWLHGEGRLLQAIDDELLTTTTTTTAGCDFNDDDAARLLLLGLAYSNPNAADRPTMAEVVQVIAKSIPPPDVPLAKPAFVWPPEGNNELLSLSEDSDDDDFVQSSHRDSDIKQREETGDYDDDSLATTMRSSDITHRKSRNTTAETTILAGDIAENCV